MSDMARLHAIEKAARWVIDEWDELGPTGTNSTLHAHQALRDALDGRCPGQRVRDISPSVGGDFFGAIDQCTAQVGHAGDHRW